MKPTEVGARLAALEIVLFSVVQQIDEEAFKRELLQQRQLVFAGLKQAGASAQTLERISETLSQYEFTLGLR